MPTDVLSTRQVAQLLGVGEATVKRWADAGEIDCFRTPGGHRKFRLRDVTSFVQKRNYKASGPLPAHWPEAAQGPAAIALLQKSALAGDIDACVAQLAAMRLRGPALEELFDDVVGPALFAIGTRWERNEISVAEEHVASQTVIDAIARAQPLAEPPGEPVRPDRGVAVIAAVAGELHDIGARMAGCLLRARGFEVLAPLAQTPARDLADLMQRSRAALTVITSTMPADPDAVAAQVELCAAAVRHAGGRVLVGGAGMRNVKLPPEVKLVASMRELMAESETASRKRSAARSVARR
jgi:excisionase family DNA binding protein